MYFLPNDILENIIEKLDIVSLIMLNATNKKMYDAIGLKWKLSKFPIQYLNKIDYISCNYTNLNDIVDDIVKELNNTNSTFKEYTYQQTYTLQIHKKKCTYSFIIRKGGKYFQFIYDPAQETYIGIKSINSFEVPILFLFLGCKILFKIHGYCDVKSFKTLPSWFLKILFSKNFNGIMIKDIINGYTTI